MKSEHDEIFQLPGLGTCCGMQQARRGWVLWLRLCKEHCRKSHLMLLGVPAPENTFKGSDRPGWGRVTGDIIATGWGHHSHRAWALAEPPWAAPPGLAPDPCLGNVGTHAGGHAAATTTSYSSDCVPMVGGCAPELIASSL